MRASTDRNAPETDPYRPVSGAFASYRARTFPNENRSLRTAPIREVDPRLDEVRGEYVAGSMWLRMLSRSAMSCAENARNGFEGGFPHHLCGQDGCLVIQFCITKLTEAQQQ